MQKIAITGGSGILATALRPYFPHADYLSRHSCDVSNAGSVKQWFGQHRYDLILHLGAETKYNAKPEALTHANVLGTANVTDFARRQEARLVYTSTDYVYPGQRGGYRETDEVQPIGDYARSKYAGELVALSYASTVVVRGSWYSQILYTRAATDAYTCKVPVAKAAAQIATVALSSVTGVVNIGGTRRSIYEIVVSESNPRCAPCTRRDVLLPYTLPADVSLDLSRYNRIAAGQ